MNNEPTPQPNTDPPPFSQDNTPYDAIGGEQTVRALTDRFYDNIRDTSPFLKDMHPPDDTESRQKLFEFLSGWLGGPQLYITKHGHPRLRMRHAHFPLDQTAVTEWIRCMTEAIHHTKIQEPARSFLIQRLTHTAHFLQNR